MSAFYRDSYRPAWDEQFRESEWERNQRMREARHKRTAEGKCWQCAKLIAECRCPNVKHAATPKNQEGAET